MEVGGRFDGCSLWTDAKLSERRDVWPNQPIAQSLLFGSRQYCGRVFARESERLSSFPLYRARFLVRDTVLYSPCAAIGISFLTRGGGASHSNEIRVWLFAWFN